MSETPEYILDRTFDAPLALVWKAWTTPDLLARWYGPGVDTIIHRFELQPGGLWLNEMKWGETSDLSRMEFVAVEPEARLEWLHSSADADWNVAPNMMMPDWPRTLRVTITFRAAGDQTKLRLSKVPVDATKAEVACFTQAMSNLSKGWGSGFAILDQVLAEMQAD
ncbi:type III effector protein [Actibacterium mucosum KCTC 23349]|uniref:Type III effector protein n=1 Tax=Actibacterium mucosum KCTC 23349 TaxID=1454373 RepID=A0A037ZLJ8_9RHOB|nr:SRPBCC domain-containing protein [Actibacterium mucosum]KAJ56959.1 type III effector protein [Actibacterium mucosum KCTC 23349]